MTRAIAAAVGIVAAIGLWYSVVDDSQLQHAEQAAEQGPLLRPMPRAMPPLPELAFPSSPLDDLLEPLWRGLTSEERAHVLAVTVPLAEHYQAQDDECEVQMLAHVVYKGPEPDACDLFGLTLTHREKMQAQLPAHVWARLRPFADVFVAPSNRDLQSRRGN